MRNIASFFFPQKDLSVGVTVTEKNVTILCLKNTGKIYQVMAYGLFDRQDIKAIQAAFKNPLLSSAAVNININEPLVKSYSLQLPNVPKKEFDQVLKWGLKAIIPDDINKLSLGVYPISQAVETTKKPYLVFTVNQDALRDYAKLLRSYGISKIQRIEPQTVALSNIATLCHAPVEQQCSLLVDFGLNNTNLSILDQKELLLTRPYFSASEEGITSLVTENLGIEKQVAQSFIENPELVPEDKRNLFQSTLFQVFAELVVELKTTVELFSAETPDSKVGSILLTGAISNLPGLADYLKTQMQVEVQHLNVFSLIDASHIDAGTVESLKPIIATSAGLAI